MLACRKSGRSACSQVGIHGWLVRALQWGVNYFEGMVFTEHPLGTSGGPTCSGGASL